MATDAVARESIFVLRQKIARIEGRVVERLETPSLAALPPRMVKAMHQPVLSTGVEAFDVALAGGLPMAGLIELHGAAVRDGAALAGFTLALMRLREKAGLTLSETPVLWLSTTEMAREAGRPYAPGLTTRFGLPSHRLLFIEAAKPIDILWAAEEAAATGVFSGMLLELRGSPGALDLLATRRLHRRALIAGHPLFLLRHAGSAQPTAAPLRLVITPEPASKRRTRAGPLAGSIGPPAFNVTVDKSRLSKKSNIILEWSDDAFHEKPAAHSGNLLSLPAGRAADAATARTVVALPRPADRSGVQSPREQHPARRGA
jgi:protein ImuA